MKNFKKMFISILVAGIVLQIFGANAFAANGMDEMVKPNEASETVAPQSAQPLSGDEMKMLTAAEDGNKALLNQSAAGWQKDMVCQGDCGGSCGPCPGESNSGGGGSRGGTIAAFGLAGAVFGSFAGASGVIIGALASGFFAAIMTSN